MSTSYSESPSKADSRHISLHVSYLPGLDGLRALAVIVVLLYHADLGWMPGGFLGVEVFFVISGYLITLLLLNEWQRSTYIDLKGFWTRRARRLLPAVLVLISSILAFAIAFLPNEVATLRGDAAAALLYSTNWYFIFAQKSYFEAVGRPSLFQHLWSLAVEEQFYLIWPPLLLFLLRRWTRRRILFSVLLGALGSTMWMALLYRPELDPSRVYYGTDTRASGLLIGAALAFVWVPKELPRYACRISSAWLDAIGAAAFLFLLGMCFWIGEYEPLLYQGGFAVVGITTALVIAIAVHPRARLGRLLSFEPLRWIGTRSYGIYLWHWPVFAMTRPQLDVPLDGFPLLLLRLVLTGVLAELSFRFVETPIRQGALGRAWAAWRQAQGPSRRAMGRRWAAAAITVLALLIGLGNSVVNAESPHAPSYLQVTAVDTFSRTETPTPAAPGVSGNPELDLATPAPVRLLGSSSTPSPVVVPITDTMPITNTPTPVLLPTATATPLLVARPVYTMTQVSAFGDSVMLGAASALEKKIPNIRIDAMVGRSFIAGIQAVQEKQAAGQLGSTVIIHLGDNGPITRDEFDLLMQSLVDVRRVIFINDKVARPWERPNNAILADGVSRYSNTTLLDWRSASVYHPEFFWDDGMHLRPEGAQFYANLILSILTSAPQ